MKEHNIPNQYYKHLESGIEMLFIFDTRQGWSVSFMNLDDMQDVTFPVPFPEDPEKYKAQVGQFHVELEKKYRNWSKV